MQPDMKILVSVIPIEKTEIVSVKSTRKIGRSILDVDVNLLDFKLDIKDIKSK